jgi:hypothetical protein
MSIMIDIAGQRFGRLTVVACAGRTKRGHSVAPTVGIDYVLLLLAPGG